MIFKRTRKNFKEKNSEISNIEIKKNLISLLINGQKHDSINPEEILCIYLVSYPYGFLIDDLEDPFYIFELPGRYWVVPGSYLDTEKLFQYCFPDGQIRGKTASLFSFPWAWRERISFFGRLFPVPCLGIHWESLNAKWELSEINLDSINR